MSPHDKKLQRWEEAGLIDAPQMQAIIAFERARGQGRYTRRLTGLGIVFILCGILSVIAANWDGIAPAVKITVHFLLNLAVAGGVYYAWRRGLDVWRESLLAVWFGLNLTLIALIGQVFQMEGALANATLLWLTVSTPLLWLAGGGEKGGRALAMVWITALLAAILLALEHYTPLFASDHNGALLVWAVLIIVPLIMRAVSRAGWAQWINPSYAALTGRAGIALICVAASLSSLAWYGQDAFLSLFTPSAAPYIAAMALGGACAAGLYAKMRKGPGLFYLFTMGSMAVIALNMAGPFLTLYSDLIGQISFILYWIFIGWVGQRMDSQRLLSASVFLIALRIFIIYCEALGGLAMTGIGLMFSGAFLLLTVWSARRIHNHLARFAALKGDMS